MSDKKRIFIGCSIENLKIAYALQKGLDYDAEPIVWTQGVFNLSSNAFDDLIEQFRNVDAAIFIFTADDQSLIRSEIKSTVRDNIIYEFGLAVGILGRNNVFAISPRDENLSLPTDLAGLTLATYDSKRSDGNLTAALGPAIYQILEQLKNSKSKYRPIIKNIDFTEDREKEHEIIIEHQYDYEPSVTILDNNGVTVHAAISHTKEKVIVSGHFAGFKGKIILKP